MYLTGLKDDYEHDGRVITQILDQPEPGAVGARASTALGECYKQLNSSVGEFGTATLQAATNAIESSSPGDQAYLQHRPGAVRARGAQGPAGRRRSRASWRRRRSATPRSTAPSARTTACRALIAAAQHLAGH